MENLSQQVQNGTSISIYDTHFESLIPTTYYQRKNAQMDNQFSLALEFYVIKSIVFRSTWNQSVMMPYP